MAFFAIDVIYRVIELP